MQDGSPETSGGIYQELVAILKEVRALRLERIALHAIESNSDSSNMGPLWSALRSQCLEVIIRLKTLMQCDASKAEWKPTMMQLYAHSAVVQVYSGVLELGLDDPGLRSSVDAAMEVMHALMPAATSRICGMLIFPVFHVGCLVQKPRDRSLISMQLAGIASEHGKANGTLAAALLRELWWKLDMNPSAIPQVEVERLMGKSSRLFIPQNFRY
jgi:hypothetical protein